MEQKRNSLGDLNDILFKQINRLDNCCPSNREQMESEIARAKTIRELAGTVIDNGKLVLAAATATGGVYEQQGEIPAMLMGD